MQTPPQTQSHTLSVAGSGVWRKGARTPLPRRCHAAASATWRFPSHCREGPRGRARLGLPAVSDVGSVLHVASPALCVFDACAVRVQCAWNVCAAASTSWARAAAVLRGGQSCQPRPWQPTPRPGRLGAAAWRSRPPAAPARVRRRRQRARPPWAPSGRRRCRHSPQRRRAAPRRRQRRPRRPRPGARRAANASAIARAGAAGAAAVAAAPRRRASRAAATLAGRIGGPAGGARVWACAATWPSSRGGRGATVAPY
jgi:hypothetical protein